jgi:hypothetical protein
VTQEDCAVMRKRRNTRQAKAPTISLQQPGRLRIANLMALLSISHQTLYVRLKSGLVPPPDGYDGVRPYWFTESIRPLLERPREVMGGSHEH